MQNLYESEWQVLKQIMRKEEFVLHDIKLCKQSMQTYLLKEIGQPSRSMLSKYGNTKAHVFLIMPKEQT